MDMRELEYFLAVVDSGGFCSAFSPAVAARTFLRPEDLADDGRLAAVPAGSGSPCAGARQRVRRRRTDGPIRAAWAGGVREVCIPHRHIARDNSRQPVKLQLRPFCTSEPQPTQPAGESKSNRSPGM